MVKYLRVEISTIDPTTAILANSSHAQIIILKCQTHFLNANLLKQLLLEFYKKSKIKSQEFSKFTANKKALMTIMFGQYNE